MKIKKSLRAVFVGSLLLVGAGSLRPVFGASVISSGRVACSTNPATPTLVSSANVNWKATRLINSNTDYVLISDSNQVFSTSASTGTARLVTPASTPPIPWIPDLGGNPYTGAIYCVGSGGGNNSTNIIDYWRMR